MEFTDDNYAGNIQFETKNPYMVQKLIDWGLVNDKNAANVLLVVIALVFFAISIFFFIRVFSGPGGGSSTTEPLPPELLEGIES